MFAKLVHPLKELSLKVAQAPVANVTEVNDVQLLKHDDPIVLLSLPLKVMEASEMHPLKQDPPKLLLLALNVAEGSEVHPLKQDPPKVLV